ncbi:hypothetical protein PI124_g2512 [Phytophthora idaei]|nr:hypothetical protein PI125_g2061 [Phytophthora idaei]KAG3171421.1 hypothetical protein PI126_g1874 [Phytophthora idaei]KAG3252894.1 hypothetical protein PI124_g2512 [Phytophthora idaei]
MATLSENVLNQAQMPPQSVLTALLELTKASYHAKISQHNSRSFANFSSNPENHPGVFSLQEFRAVFTLAQSAEEFCGRDAAMCLGDLAVTSHNQFQISELGGLGPLSDLLKREFASTQLVLSIDSVPTPRTSIVLWTPVLFLRFWLGCARRETRKLSAV